MSVKFNSVNDCLVVGLKMNEQFDFEEVDADITILFFETVPTQSTPIKKSKTREVG